jgi:hypothetical protein
LRIVAIIATALAFVRLFVGSRSGRSVAGWLLLTALLGAWLGFLLSYERIRDAGFRSLVKARIDELHTLARTLTAYDGKAKEVKTNIGSYAIDTVRMPNAFLLRNREGWWTHTDPWRILRLTDNGLLLSFSTPDRFFVEYHPDSNRPSVKHIPSYKLPFGNKFAELSFSESLGNGWYLTAYDE